MWARVIASGPLEGHISLPYPLYHCFPVVISSSTKKGNLVKYSGFVKADMLHIQFTILFDMITYSLVQNICKI